MKANNKVHGMGMVVGDDEWYVVIPFLPSYFIQEQWHKTFLLGISIKGMFYECGAHFSIPS